MKKVITLTFLQYYYLLKSLLFKVLLLNPKAKQAIAKRCSEDILFWLEFFVKLPPQNQPSSPKNNSRVHNRPGETVLNDKENMGIGDEVAERGESPLCGEGDHPPEALCDSLGSSPFLKGLGQEDAHLSNHETNTTSIERLRKATEGGVCEGLGSSPFSKGLGKNSEATERSGASLDKHLGSKPFYKGLGDLSLSNRIQQLKKSFKPQTTYKTYFWLKYKKDYILEIKARIENNQPLLVSKSANMDETTCTALVLLWFWLYKEDANFYVLGQTAKHLYYTKDSNSIFNLYKYMLNHLPHSLFNNNTDLPKPYTFKVNRKKKFFIKLINHINGNIIYGFSGAKRNYFPQHKQIKGVWLSDFAFHKKQQEHYQALQNISQCLIITSIPNGKGNLFYELSLNKDLDHYKLHWLLNPHYDDIWYKNIVANIDLNNVHQFLDIGFDYKIRRTRMVQIAKPVKKVAKKVETIQATVRSNCSTFSKTFTEIKTARKLYHRNAKSVYIPESYELAKKSLANASLRVVNIPAVRENRNDIVYLRWQKMNKLIRQNNYAQLSSVKTALKVLFHYQPELTTYLLEQPQLPKVNCKINNNYERIHFKTLFPYAISKKEEKQNQSTLLKNNSPVPMRQEENFFNNHETKQGEALCEGLGSSPFLKGIGKDSEATERSGASLSKNSGITSEAGERGETPLCGEWHLPPFLKGPGDVENQPTSDLNNNQETSSTNNKGVGKATEGGVCGKGDHPPEFFEHYKKKRNYRVRSTKFNITIKPPKFQRNKENKEPDKPP